MSISHSLETLSDKQKSDLQLAQTLLDNLNSLKPSHERKNALEFDGEKFREIQAGFLNRFLIDDIHLAVKHDLEKHKDFILQTVRRETQSNDLSDKFDNNAIRARTLLNAFMGYYTGYPIYSDNLVFNTFIEELKMSLKEKMPKS